ncbi:MAG: helix-turn-helix transcriptional regulator [Tissierellia bacterium]|jgi:transcriptional regulator with XRE-family HTH domain|nr:helix-turn-helix transcriptional regulator [Tissierellia bacterium]
MLGNKIRHLRKSQKLKLNDVAERSGLSVSYISQLERDLVEPSLSSLKKIASALSTPIYLLIDDSEHDNILMRKEERPVMSFANTHTKFEIVSTTTQNINFSPKMLMVQFFIPPGSEDSEDYLTHTAEELIVLIQGKLEVTYGDSVYQLESGDSIYVQENIPHRIVNISEEEAIGYYVVTPPSIPKHES